MDKIELKEIYNYLGDEKLKRIVNRLYDYLEKDTILSKMFERDTSEGRENQYLFLKYIFGGSKEYIMKRGHPMMRKRHFPFAIGWDERNAWFNLMMKTLNEFSIEEPVLKRMEQYFSHMATKIMNSGIITKNSLL